MKKFLSGLILGLILATTAAAVAAPQVIRLIVNGAEVPSDPSPQMIQGRVFVPVRFVAEALGADVKWDGANNIVGIDTETAHITNKTSQTINNNGYDGTVREYIPDGYYPGRTIINALGKKYPDIKLASSNLGIEPKQGEFRFHTQTGELWFNGQHFLLPVHSIGDRMYFGIDQLIEAQILTAGDINLLQ